MTGGDSMGVSGAGAGPGEEEIAVGIGALLRAEDAIPAHVVDAARASYHCRAAEDELAELTYDSFDDLFGLTAVRGSSTRQLCFAAGDTSVELELREGAQLLVGQLIPTGSADVELATPADPRSRQPRRRLRADELGRFAIEDLPAGPIRLRFTPAAGRPMTTDWFRT